MKIAVEHRRISIEGAQESKEAQIAASPTMMAALAGLYSDPVLAICREYMTNMNDGYIRLRKLRPGARFIPPVVHAPNALEPWIEFTDYGIGMGYDEVWNIYTKFGESTKQGSNDEVGGLGLGSKTAFTYPGADVWFVEARQDGQRHVIHCTKDDRGMPTFHRMASEPTDQPNGVSVRLPVRPQDFAAFAGRIQDVLTYFPIECKVVGANIVAAKPKYIHKGATWGVRQSGDAKVIMGNVAYPVATSQLPYGLNGRRSAAQLVLGGPVDLQVGIGDVDITPSREHLKYTDRTKAALERAAKAVLAEIRDQATQAVSKAMTFWEANVAYYRFRNTDWLKSVAADGVTWRGRPLKHEGVEFNIKSPTLAPLGIVDMLRLTPGAQTTIKHDHGVEGAYLVPDGYYHMLVDDVPRGGIKRAVHWITPEWFIYQTMPDGRYERQGRKSDNGARYHYVTGAVFVIQGDAALAQRLSQLLGGMPVRLTSSLPEAPKPAKAQGTRKQTSTLLGWRGGEWKDTEVDTKQGGLYVRFDNGNHVGRGYNSRIAWHRERAIAAGLLDKDRPVYGIPRRAKSVENRANWLHFHDEYLMPRLREAVKARAADLAARRAWTTPLQDDIVRFLIKLPPDGLPADVKAFVVRAAEMCRISDELEALDELAAEFEVRLPPNKNREAPDLDFRALRKNYPLLRLLGNAREAEIASTVRYLRAERRARGDSAPDSMPQADPAVA